MAFDGTEGGEITLEEGAILTARYRATHPLQRKGHFFGKEILNDILARPGCVGIRMYHGLDTLLRHEMVLVGADAEGDDMLDLVADKGLPCPASCPQPNELNPR